MSGPELVGERFVRFERSGEFVDAIPLHRGETFWGELVRDLADRDRWHTVGVYDSMDRAERTMLRLMFATHPIPGTQCYGLRLLVGEVILTTFPKAVVTLSDLTAVLGVSDLRAEESLAASRLLVLTYPYRANLDMVRFVKCLTEEIDALRGEG